MCEQLDLGVEVGLDTRRKSCYYRFLGPLVIRVGMLKRYWRESARVQSIHHVNVRPLGLDLECSQTALHLAREKPVRRGSE